MWPEWWVVSSYAIDDGERLLLLDPLAPPSEIDELAAERETAIVLTCPFHARDARSLAERLGAPLYVPPPDEGDPNPLDGQVFRAGDRLPVGVEAFPGMEPNDLVLHTPRAHRPSRPRARSPDINRVPFEDVRSRTRIAAAALGACVAVLLPAAAGAAGPGLVKQLQRGGLVLVLRHAVTDQSKQDADPVDLADCATQRNLSAEGRLQARAIGRAARRLRLPIGTVLTSRFCRTRETALLAFGRGKVEPALLNTIDAAHDAAWNAQIRAARRLIGTPPRAGTLTVLVTHGVVVTDATSLSLEEGETLVFRPLGDSRYRLVGRIGPNEWNGLRKPAASRPRVKEYPVPDGSHPHDVAPARDGTVWYTAQAAGKLGRLDPATGKITEVQLGEGSAPHGVIVGPDGGAWVTDSGRNAIVRVDHETLEVKRYPLPASSGYTNLNTATFDRRGRLWFTGQSGIYGRLDPRTGAVRVFRAPLGAGPYGIATTPGGQVWYASLAGSHVARIDVSTGKATVVRPPTPGQGARRIWSDSHGRLWVSEWNAGKVARYDPATRRWREWRLPGAAQPYAVFVDDRDVVWLTDFAAGAIVRFDPATQRFTTLRLRAGANVRQLLGRPGELWGAESGTDRLVSVTT